MSAIQRLRQLERLVRRRIAERTPDVIPVVYYDLLPDGTCVYLDTPPPDMLELMAKAAELVRQGSARGR